MPAESVIERLRQISATFDEDRNLYGPIVAPPNDLFARNKHGDVLDFDGEETALVINALPLLLAVAEAADELYALRIRVTPEEFDSAEGSRAMAKLDLAVRALRAGGSHD